MGTRSGRPTSADVVSRALRFALVLAVALAPVAAEARTFRGLVFTQRRVPDHESIRQEARGGPPGVGPRDRFSVGAPGSLVLLQRNGRLRVLVDGENPRPESLHLVDVSAPSMSRDGRTVVFAGWTRCDHGGAGAWRIYAISTNGENLRAVTSSDAEPAGAPGLAAHDDTDPAFLPDGRIVFSSTRWPSFAWRSGVRTTNLYVTYADGSGLRRITAERNGADRPLVDPVTGRIVYFRYRPDHRPPGRRDDVNVDPAACARTAEAGPVATLLADGTGLANGPWVGLPRGADGFVHGGAFTTGGELIANVFTAASSGSPGRCGLRRLRRVEIAASDPAGALEADPASSGVSPADSSREIWSGPAVLPSGRIVASCSTGDGQDLGIFVLRRDGSVKRLVYDEPGTIEAQVQVVIERSPSIAAVAGAVANLPTPR